MANKDAREAALKKGLERLRESGIDTEKVSAAALPALAAELGKDHDADLAIAFLLGRVTDPAAAAALTGLERSTASKDVKREARRSLFKLEQRGMKIARAEEPRAAPRPAFKLGPEIEGFISSVDGPGVRLVWLTKPAESGLQLLQGMVSDRVGLVDVSGAFVKRKELRERAQTIKESHGISMVPVPWDYADQMLYQGYETAKASGRGETEQFLSLRSVFNPVKPRPVAHPIYGKLGAASARADDAWRERSRRLLDEPEFRFWILDEDWMKPYLDRIEEAQGSRLVLNQAQKEERFAAIVRDAAREIFAGDAGRILARRMEDMALYLLETGRAEPARLALAVALQLAEGEIGILDLAFLTGLAQKSLAFYLSRAKEKAAEEPSLIVKP